MAESALIVGTGPGLSASLARLCAKEGMQVGIAARNVDKLANLAAETGARVYGTDATSKAEVDAMFDAFEADCGIPDLVVYNASGRARGPFAELDADEVAQALNVTAFAGFLVGQAAVKRMLTRGSGTVEFTGASASVKGYPRSAPFAMGKFALRGMVQSMARELHPQNIHVAHFVIDGGIAPSGRDSDGERLLEADHIAETYLQVHRQHRSSWTWEVELRPWVETF